MLYTILCAAEVNTCCFLQLSQCDTVQSGAVCLRPLRQSQGHTEGNTHNTILNPYLVLAIISVIITLYKVQKVLKFLKKVLIMTDTFELKTSDYKQTQNQAWILYQWGDIPK